MNKKKVIIISGIIIAVLSLAIVAIVMINLNSNTEEETELISESIADENDLTLVEKADSDVSGDVANTEVLPEEHEPTEEEIFAARVEEVLSSMTLDQKIYQMFVVAPEQLIGGSGITTAGEETLNKLKEYPIGGFIYFGSNVRNPEQIKTMLTNTLEYGYEVEGLPLFLCTDEEGGRVARIAGNDNFGDVNVGAMGKIKDESGAYSAGSYIGSYMSYYGFNVDLAPDADVITVASNTAIGDRSFGSDPQIVSDYAAAFSDGLHNSYVLSTYKHYPGHGATLTDTHHGLTYINKSYEEMQKAELVPFAQAQENNIDMIMVAHISLPNITGDDTPCSLSKIMIDDYLRKDMGYEGLIITDALNMEAVTSIYSTKTMAVMAVEAGNDLLLMPMNISEAYAGIREAVDNGEISEERIDESLRRIIAAKLWIMDGNEG